jgi:hypothetical protein
VIARVWRVLTLAGWLPVRICPLCAALVAAEGEARHAAPRPVNPRVVLWMDAGRDQCVDLWRSTGGRPSRTARQI